jgi:uncharacterized protein HemX
MTESSASFQTTEPPAPSPEPPRAERPKRPRRGRRILLVGVVAVVVLAGLGVGAWWAITNYNELNDTRADLEATQGDLAALQVQSADQSDQITQLESQSAGLRSNLDDRTTELAGLRTEHNQLVADHDQLVTDEAALSAAHTSLREAVDSMALDLGSARDMAEAFAAIMIPVGSSIDSRLSAETLAVRDDLAALIGWFETAGDYDTSEFLAFFRLTSAIDDLGDEALTEAFQAYADAPSGSQAEIDAFAEFVSRFLIDTLNNIDELLQQAEAAVAG